MSYRKAIPQISSGSKLLFSEMTGKGNSPLGDYFYDVEEVTASLWFTQGQCVEGKEAVPDEIANRTPDFA